MWLDDDDVPVREHVHQRSDSLWSEDLLSMRYLWEGDQDPKSVASLPVVVCLSLFCLAFWALYPFEDGWTILFVLLLGLYPLALLSELLIRIRYSKVVS